SHAQQGTDPWAMQTECLVVDSTAATLQVTVRFLHLMLRQVGELAQPRSDWPADREPEYPVVASLQVDGKQWHTWQEAVERTISVGAVGLRELADEPQRHPFRFPALRTLEPLQSSSGQIIGVLERRQEALAGLIEVSANHVGEGLFKVR